MMNRQKPRIIKQNDPLNGNRQMPEDLYRLANSMRLVLVRRYPDPEERQVMAGQIMQRVKGAACS